MGRKLASKKTKARLPDEVLEFTPDQRAEVEHKLCENSLLYFASTHLTGGAEHGGKFIVGQHHVEWDAIVQKAERICVLAPRDHGKSYYFNLAYPIWRGKYQPRGTQVYLFSANQTLSEEFLQKIVEELTTNPKLSDLVPRNWESTWAKRRIRLTTGVELRARGFGVKVRGGHPKFIVADDMLGDDHIYSETIREKGKDYFLSAITNMVIPGGQLIVVGTPLHQSDVYAHLRKVKRYTCWKEPAISKKGKVLWPERYDKEALLAKKEEIGSVRFTREFLVEPFSDEMSLFPSHLFEGAPVQQYTIKLGMPAAFWNEIGVTSRFMGVDIAISTTTGADYFVCFVLGRDAMGNRWVCDIVREKGMPFQKQLDTINSVAQRLDPSLIFIESNQMQRVWADELIRTTDLPIKAFITTGTGTMKSKALTQSANKHQLEAGVPSLAPTLENRKWRIPRGDARSVEMTDLWMQEMQAMSFIEGKVQSVGEHDDMVLACWIADQALRRGGFSVSFGDANAGSFNIEEELMTRRKDGDAKEDAGPPLDAVGRPKVPAEPGDVAPASGNLGAAGEPGDPSATALWSAMPFARGG